MEDAGMTPDPWQRRVLESQCQELQILASRQVGKSQVTGAVALMTALREPGSLTLLLSPTARQSGELLATKVMPLYWSIAERHPEHLAGGGTLRRGLVMSLEFQSGSRIIALPGKPEGIRGYSGVALLVIDEAAFVSDALYHAVRPMLATSQGRIVCLSTPYGKRGFFFNAWENEDGWQRFEARSSQCPRIRPEFLVNERAKLGERMYRQEHMCDFLADVGAVFDPDDLEAAFNSRRGGVLDLGLGGGGE